MSPRPSDLGKILGAEGGGIVVLTSFVADFDCQANDPLGLGRNARSMIADKAIAIHDVNGAVRVIPDVFGARQYAGFEIAKILNSSAGTTSTAIVVIW